MEEKMTQSRFHPRWMAATVLSVVGVLGLTHIPGEDIPRVLQVHYLDKVEHVVAYGLITGFFLLSLKRPARPEGRTRSGPAGRGRFRAAVPLIGLAALAALGALDEMTQPLVNRVASVADYACDLLGVAIPSVVFLVGRLSRTSAADR
jgi:hypothetical protein